MKFLGLKQVLVLSPHPDDAEYSMSGVAMKYTNTTFYILTMSAGGNFDLSSGSSRFDEVQEFWKRFHNVVVLEPNHSAIADTQQDQLVNIVDQHFEHYDFDGIMCPPKQDTHFEHRAVHNIARAACRLRGRSFVEYCTPSTYPEWTPNLFVDVSHELNAKKTNLHSCFRSQSDRHYFDDKVMEDFHSDFFCSKRGYSRVEKFKVDFLIV